MSTHGPIEEDHRAMMNAFAHALDEMLNPGGDRKIGFVLLLAKFGEVDNGRVNYISNGDRSDMIKMMEEYLARATGKHPEEQEGTSSSDTPSPTPAGGDGTATNTPSPNDTTG